MPEQKPNSDPQVSPKIGSLIAKWQSYNEREKQVEKKPEPVTDEVIMSAVLDAFEDDVNVGDEKKLGKWLRDNGYEPVSDWLARLSRSDFFTAISSFFGNMGRIRKQVPGMMTGMNEQVNVPDDIKLEPSDEPEAPEGEPKEPEASPEEKPEPEEEPDKEKLPIDLNTVVMDMYLEGVDITRRAQLVSELEKAGFDAEVETVSGFSLPEFYSFLSTFFGKLSDSLKQDSGTAVEDEPTQLEKRDVNELKWEKMTAEERVLALTDGGIPEDKANEYSEMAWDDIPIDAQEAFTGSFSPEMEPVAENKDLQLPYGKKSFRRKKMRKMLTVLEAPEEFLPKEIKEAEDLVKNSVMAGFSLDEAVKKVTAKLTKMKKLPKKLSEKLEIYLGEALKNLSEEEEAPEKDDDEGEKKDKKEPKIEKDEKDDDDDEKGKKEEPKKEAKAKKEDDDDDDEDEDEDDDEDEKKDKKEPPAPELSPEKPTAEPPAAEPAPSPQPAAPAAAVGMGQPPEVAMVQVDEMAWDTASEDDRKEYLTKVAGLNEKKAADLACMEYGSLPEVIKKALKGEDVELPSDEPEDEPEDVPAGDDNDKIMGEMMRLALAPSGRHFGASTCQPRTSPKSISLTEDTTSPGVMGARDTGTLDVFSYGGYLEKALPYLIAASMSRFDEMDKTKFVNLYRKFTETNDIIEMTKIAGSLADVVEWGDATQEGAELVKNLRFLSDFLNVVRGSVDFTKKAFPIIA